MSKRRKRKSDLTVFVLPSTLAMDEAANNYAKSLIKSDMRFINYFKVRKEYNLDQTLESLLNMFNENNMENEKLSLMLFGYVMADTIENTNKYLRFALNQRHFKQLLKYFTEDDIRNGLVLDWQKGSIKMFGVNLLNSEFESLSRMFAVRKYHNNNPEPSSITVEFGNFT